MEAQAEFRYSRKRARTVFATTCFRNGTLTMASNDLPDVENPLEDCSTDFEQSEPSSFVGEGPVTWNLTHPDLDGEDLSSLHDWLAYGFELLDDEDPADASERNRRRQGGSGASNATGPLENVARRTRRPLPVTDVRRPIGGAGLLRIVYSIQREKNVAEDILFDVITSAIQASILREFSEAKDVEVNIDRETGQIDASSCGQWLDPAELGRIAAQTAKQVIIQKIREAERDSLFEEFEDQRGDLVTGAVQRFEGGAVIVNLGKTNAILPSSEQIPGKIYHPNDRIRAIILEVRKVGQRLKIILGRTHSDFVRRLFELEIPEIADQIVAIRALAREPGYRSKVAVASIDTKVDAVGACVGVRGTRIKNIVDELGGERIDIVRWNESLEVLIPNALQPAEIDEVMLCHLMGRAIVLVRDDQLSLAIGRRGQNVRLASKLVGWDIEIMTAEGLDEVIEKAVKSFEKIDVVDTELAERLVEQGILSFDDLSVMEITDLVNTIEGITEEQAVKIVSKAEILAELQTEGLPQRRGARAAESAPAGLVAVLEQGETERRNDLTTVKSTATADLADGEGTATNSDAMTADSSSALSSERASTDPDKPRFKNKADSEQHEAGNDDTHDRAMGAGKSKISFHGAKLTLPPSTVDQGEITRNLTEAAAGESRLNESSDASTEAKAVIQNTNKPSGEIFMRLPNPHRSLLRAKIVRSLAGFADEHNIGRVLCTGGASGLSSGSESLRTAYICYYPYSTLPEGPMPRSELTAVPDLVVEIREPEERWNMVLSRVVHYLSAGVVVVCVFDAEARTVRAYSADHPEQVLTAGQELDLSPVLVGLRVSIDWFFD
jgi:N utilization substance protein A